MPTSPPSRGLRARLKQARQRLGLARHEIEKLARMAENPALLDSELLTFSEAALRERLRAICARGEMMRGWALGMIELPAASTELPLAVEIIHRDTRGGDFLARTGRARFALLLEDCDGEGAETCVHRLAKRLVAARPGAFRGIRMAAMELSDALAAPCPLEALRQRLRAFGLHEASVMKRP